MVVRLHGEGRFRLDAAVCVWYSWLHQCNDRKFPISLQKLNCLLQQIFSIVWTNLSKLERPQINVKKFNQLVIHISFLLLLGLLRDRSLALGSMTGAWTSLKTFLGENRLIHRLATSAIPQVRVLLLMLIIPGTVANRVLVPQLTL